MHLPFSMETTINTNPLSLLGTSPWLRNAEGTPRREQTLTAPTDIRINEVAAWTPRSPDGTSPGPRCSGGKPRKKGTMVAPENIPNYEQIKEDPDGNAILPCDFLPAVFDKLPDDWFYSTYSWFKYFDWTQRDTNGNAFASSGLTTANPVNIEKWKVVARRIFHDSFKEEGKYRYGLEVGRMALRDGIQCGGKKGGRRAETPDLAMKVLFGSVAPELLEKDYVGQLIAYAFKWMHVPNLEGNNQWVKDGLLAYFQQNGAKVAFSDKMTEKKLSHAIVKMFKKYGTQRHQDIQEQSTQTLGVQLRN